MLCPIIASQSSWFVYAVTVPVHPATPGEIAFQYRAASRVKCLRKAGAYTQVSWLAERQQGDLSSRELQSRKF